MVYLLPFTIYSIYGAIPEVKLWKSGDPFKILTSFRESGSLKNACQIHRSYDATASRIMVDPSLCPMYAPLQAVEHLSHLQCIQSMELSIPRNPLALFMAINLAVSRALGALKYSSPKISIIAFKKCFKDSMIVLSPSLT
jgi:hypothetical protein